MGLFVYRVGGVALFELVGSRWILLLFPNLFENWFLSVLVTTRWFPAVRDAIRWPRGALLGLLVLTLPKLGQEYLLHIAEAQPWGWFKDLIGI